MSCLLGNLQLKVRNYRLRLLSQEMARPNWNSSMEDHVYSDVMPVGESAVDKAELSDKAVITGDSQVNLGAKKPSCDEIPKNPVTTTCSKVNVSSAGSSNAETLAESERITSMSEPNLIDDHDNVNASGILASEETNDQTLQESALSDKHTDESPCLVSEGLNCASSAIHDRTVPSDSNSTGDQRQGEGTELRPADGHNNLKETMVCAGCGKVLGQGSIIPQRRKRTVVLSLCDDCENITSAMFVCLNCGQECRSLAALRAHKRTHVIVQQPRVYVCEMCGIDFPCQSDFDVHECAVPTAVEESVLVESRRIGDEDSADRKRNELPTQGSRPRRNVSRKVRVEDIVNSLTKRTRTVPKTAEEQDDAPKKTRTRRKTKAVPKPVIEPLKIKLPNILKMASSPKTRKLPAISLSCLNPVNKPKPRKRKRKTPNVSCPDCSEIFTDSKEYRRHKLIHKQEKLAAGIDYTDIDLVSDHVCEVCNKSFQSPQSLYTHRKTIHSNQKPFVCDICQRPFKQMGNLKTHRRTHTGERPFNCTVCEKSFAQKGNLRDHMVMHAPSKPHVCEICGKSFSYVRSLKNHTRGTHTGERPYACGECGKTFSNQSVFRDHKRTHSDKRPYLCDKCGKGFKIYKNLKQHEKFHLDVRPYNCEVCGKSFVWHKSFSLHKRTHTGEKPYACDQCDKAFTNINSLKNHKHKHLLPSQAPLVPSKATLSTLLVPDEALSGTDSPASSPPPLSPHSLSNQALYLSGLYSRQPRDHGEPSGQGHPLSQPQTSSSLDPTVTSILQQRLAPHTQAYSHVVLPQPFPTYVTSAGGDFTIL